MTYGKCLKCLFQQCRSIKFRNFWPLSTYTMEGNGGLCVTLKQGILDTSGIPKKISGYITDSIEMPFNNSDHPVSLESKHYDINNINKLSINKNLSLATLHLNISLLSKHFEDLQNSLSLSKDYFDFIGISEQK